MTTQANVCRMYYGALKALVNAPVMLVVKHTWGYFIEVRDTGEVMFEQLEACCK